MRPLWPPLVRADRAAKARARAAADAKVQPRIPLTHHEILALAEPFCRSGRHVDLAASDRLARRICFQTRLRPDGPDDAAHLTEALVLDNPGRAHYRLTRILADAAGRVATLRAAGPDPGALLERIDAVPPSQQFVALAGLCVTRSYRIEEHVAPRGTSAGSDRRRVHLVLLRAETEFDGMRIALDPQVGQGMPAELSLETSPECPLALPEDLLMVLGAAWRPLQRWEQGWRAHLRIPAQEPRRTPDVESKLERTLVHLVATLRGAPSDFHHRWARERWQTFLGRIGGLIALVAMVVATPAMILMLTAPGAPLRVLAFGLPALAALLVLARHEDSVLRRPPRPAPLPEDAWGRQARSEE
jgi:hypothetical protein